MANPGLSELVTTTLRNRSRQLADNVTNNNALFSRLNGKGNLVTIDGGRTIVEPMEYAENATFQYYTGYEVLDISPSDVITAAEFDWKQASVNVTWSGLEGEIQNSGREQQINLIDSRIRVAEKTMANNLSTGAYSDGTGSSGKQVGGLQLLVPKDPTTGTVGGIDRSTAGGTFYRSQVTTTTALSATNIQTNMNALWVKTVRGGDKPDLIPADNNLWQFYLKSLQTVQRFTNDKMASAGFDNLKFMSADVFFDTGGGCPTNTMFMLNTDFIRLKVHKNRNMTPMDDKVAINQDASVVPLLWAGNMTLSNAARQGHLTNT